MTTHNDIVKALEDLKAKEWSLYGDNISDIVWETSDVKTEDEILAAIAKPLKDKAPTIEQKLASVGLSVTDLKAALGI
jgi:hypothetical protein